jgi:cell division protein FtsB
MSLAREMKRRAKIALPPFIFLSITGYFAWNATQGDRGLVAYAHRLELQQQVLAERDAAQTERDGWDNRVRGLRTKHLNPDTLDERARSMLNLAQPDEVIVKLAAQDKLF